MSFFASIADKIGLATNWLLILVFLATGFGYGMAMGKNRMNLITLAAFFSLVISAAIPWGSLGFIGIKNAPPVNIQVFIFLAIVLAIFFVAPHTGLASIVRVVGRGRASWWQLFIFGVLQLGMLVSIVVSFLPAKDVTSVSPLLSQFFLDQEAKFLWLFLPILAMMVLRRRKPGEE